MVGMGYVTYDGSECVVSEGKYGADYISMLRCLVGVAV